MKIKLIISHTQEYLQIVVELVLLDDLSLKCTVQKKKKNQWFLDQIEPHSTVGNEVTISNVCECRSIYHWKKIYIIFDEALLLMENNHNFQKENSENFHMICVRILPILKIQTSTDMNLCLCHPHFHRAGGWIGDDFAGTCSFKVLCVPCYIFN